jgi:hypothetical protein
MFRFSAAAFLLALVSLGCDKKTVQKNVGQAEVVAGQAMQAGGARMVVQGHHPAVKATGVAVYGGGVLVEEDGRRRLTENSGSAGSRN